MIHADDAAAPTGFSVTGGARFLAAASPWFWGGVMTWGFYLALPHLPVYAELMTRYFCGHEIAYAETGLFFVGLAILLEKLIGLGAEKRAVRQSISTPTGDLAGWCHSVTESVQRWPERLRQTRFSRRIDELTRFLTGRKSSEGIDAHARRLADEAADDLYDSYGLVQTVIWAVPILGFLGTVIGITMAIANLTPEQLDNSLNTVTSGLGVAFDTTAQALVLSIILVFGYLYTKKAEQGVLSGIDRRVTNEIVACLVTQPTEGHPLLEAETQAARQLMDRTETLIQQQTELWKDSVDALRERWAKTLDVQQQELASALSFGMQNSLDQHTGSLETLRQEFLTSYRGITEEAAKQMQHARVMQEAQQQQLQTAWSDAWEQMRNELAAERTARSEEAEQWFGEFGRQVQLASQRFEEASQASQAQMAALSQQTQLLARIVDQEENLAGLQTRLTENLEAIRAAESFEETLHNLNAAIHLMIARTRPKAA